MSSSTPQELLESSLQLNLRLAASLGVLFAREEREKMRVDVIQFITKIAQAAEISTERQMEMVNECANGPFEPITDGLIK